MCLMRNEEKNLSTAARDNVAIFYETVIIDNCL